MLIVEEALEHDQRPLMYAGLAYAHQLLWELDPDRRRHDALLALTLMQRADELARARLEWNVDYAFNLGTAYFNAGRVGEALPHLEEYVRARPRHFGGRFGLGFAFLRAGRAFDARRELELAVELEPGDVNAWGNLAMAAEKLGDRSRALECYRRVIELQPGHPTATARMRAMTDAGAEAKQ